MRFNWRTPIIKKSDEADYRRANETLLRVTSRGINEGAIGRKLNELEQLKKMAIRNLNDLNEEV